MKTIAPPAASKWMLLLALLFAAACNPYVRDNVDPRISDFDIQVPAGSGEGPWVEPQCSPAPPPVETPCSGVPCKPCQMAVCRNGGWTIVDKDWSAVCGRIEANNTAAKLGPACMRNPRTKVCPDECALCF